MNGKQHREQADDLFKKRSTLLNLWQEISDNFYVERADFTVSRTIGMDFAAHLSTSYPLLCRRDLGDQFGAMLRPTAKPWFHMITSDPRRETNQAKRWLQWAEGLMRRAMYDRHAMFTRASKEGDHDFAAFGQAVLQLTLNRNSDALLYRCWHLRDVAWQENADGKICPIYRKWKPGARNLWTLFGDKNDQRVKTVADKTPFEEIECLHMIVESDTWDDKSSLPYVSVYYDCKHNHVIEAIPVRTKQYIIPRWQTVSGSQYAFSPATVAALPDGRLLQSMTYTLLEAGEKLTNPPMVATDSVVKSDVAIYAGGITWVDAEYDERLGDALRPLTQDAKGMPIGIDMQRDSRAMLKEAFYLNKLTLPQRAPEMTAYEVGQRIQEYIRGALPLFEPMETEYNGGICEETFDQLFWAQAFGPIDSIPEELLGADIDFRFESPLHDAIDAQKGAKFMEAKGLIAEAVALDQSALAIIDAKVALRDALNGIGVPAVWQRDEITVQQIEEAQQAAQQAQQTLAALEQSSKVAANLGGAASDMATAQAV